MELIRSVSSLPTHLRNGAVSIGNFDGVHRGHGILIAQLVQRAKEIQGAAIVFTFDPHPVRILRPHKAPVPLTWTERKAELLNELGVDALIAYPATRELLSKSYQDFFHEIIVGALSASAVVEGPNFFFGQNREGDIQRLAELCGAADILCDIVKGETNGDEMISSSRIRSALASGDVNDASKMLTARYRIRGMVTHGVGRGAELGFPTANVEAVDTLVPGNGVYAGTAHVGGKAFWAAVHIGQNPTFSDATQKIEVHLLDFDATIYGEPIEIEFYDRIRGVQKFESAEQLKQQIQYDLGEIRNKLDAAAAPR